MTGEVIAQLAQGTREDTRQAIAAANSAQPALAGLSTWDRSCLCRRVAEAMERRKEELARVLSEDQGKPLHSEAKEDAAVSLEETFGPAAPVIEVKDDEEALRNADTDSLRLVAAVFTTNPKRAYWFAERLRTGIVNAPMTRPTTGSCTSRSAASRTSEAASACSAASTR